MPVDIELRLELMFIAKLLKGMCFDGKNQTNLRDYGLHPKQNKRHHWNYHAFIDPAAPVFLVKPSGKYSFFRKSKLRH